MRTKIILLLLLIPIILVVITFSTTTKVKLPIEQSIEGLVLEHDLKEAVTYQVPFKLYAHTIPSTFNDEIIWTTSDKTIATVEDGYLISHKEGVVSITARVEDGSFEKSFKAYICEESDYPKYVVINNSLDTLGGISSEYCYGEYSIVNSKFSEANLELSIDVLPLNVSQEFTLEAVTNNIAIENGKVLIKDGGKATVKATSKADPSISDTYSFNVIDEGVNVFSYEDLLACTNNSPDGKKVVMQTNLESVNNAYLGEALLPNTKLFGYGDKDNLSFDYLTMDSTYDTTFLDNMHRDKTIKMAINFKDDVYGNGYTINLHEMAYPSEELNDGTPVLGKNDLFTGTKSFVEMVAFKISGQDNIGFGVTKDNVIIDNINLKNCNNVTDLTYLDLVGTTLEVMADNVTIKNCIISNGRNVVRSFSSANLMIDNCLLQYAREFILKLGSNSFLKPEPGHNEIPLSPSKQMEFLSPIPYDEDGNILSDSSCHVNDTYFYKSGFFSICIDTLFAGEVLYNGNINNNPIPMLGGGLYNIAGTSYQTNLHISGDTRLYNWVDVSKLDASSLIESSLDTGDSDFTEYFDIANMIKNMVSNTNFIFRNKDNTDDVVHGGIAFYGGGRNLSTCTIDDNLLDGYSYLNMAINDPRFGGKTSVLAYAAGYGDFKFYLYTKDTVIDTMDGPSNLYLKTPSLSTLRSRAK